MKTDKLRWLLLAFSLAAMMAALLIPFPVVKLALLCALSVACLFLLYRNMEALTGIPEDSPKNHTM